MIESVIGRQCDGFFAGADAGIPGTEFEVSAAELVVGFRSGCGVDLLLKGLNCLICVAGV